MNSSFHPSDYIGDVPLVSVIIVTYNHEKYIKKCLESVLNQKYPLEVIVTDNCSIDSTKDIIQKNFTEVRIILPGNNIGYGAANNIGSNNANGEILVFLNPDTYVDDNWLINLVTPLLKVDNIITTPKILTYDGKFINTCGNINHFTGITITRGYGAVPEEYSEEMEVSGVSGACFAIKKENYIDLGGFDESIFLYNEDSDLSWNAHSQGFSIHYIPDSIVYHDYSFRMSPNKIYNLEKGRYRILHKYYTKRWSIILLPSLIMAEVLSFGFTGKLGWMGFQWKMKSIIDGIQCDDNEHDSNFQTILPHLHSKIPEDQVPTSTFDRIFFRIANYIFQSNYRLAKWRLRI